jgi:hypothetical protein
MPLDELKHEISTVVPENNLRLPDALTVKYGSAPLLSRFVVAGDRYFRERGVTLRLRYDFDELAYINKQEIARGRWYPLIHVFNPEYTELSAENAYWMSGEDEHGEIVLTQAGRVYHWPETSFADEARLMFYGGREVGQRCTVTSEAARSISGWVLNGGGLWIRPDFRGNRFPSVIGRLGRAYSTARWPLDWSTCYVTTTLFARGNIAESYGYPHVTRSIFFPKSPLGDLECLLLYMRTEEIYDDLANFLSAGSLADGASASEMAPELSLLGDTVTRTSSEVVRHGSTSLS